jgi:hypothetical protein
VPLISRTQIAQPARYEKEHKGNDHEFIVISLGEKGLLLVRDTEKFEQRKRTWEIIALDTMLHETWDVKLSLDNIYNILGHDYRDGNAYLVFRESNNPKGKLNLMEIDLSAHSIIQHEFKTEVDISFTHFSVLQRIGIFGGYISREPTILMYDMRNESAKVLPGTFGPHLELLDLRTNANNTFNALLTERKSKSAKKLIIRTYDINGVVLIDDEINVDDDKSILTGITSTLINDEMIITGTWTEGSGNTQASGIYSVMVDPFKDQTINYYDFTGLKHFLDYIPDKKAERIRAKAEWRRSVGKPVEFKAYVSSVRLEESKNGFSFLSEVYIPASNFNNNRWGNPYGYPYSNPYYSPYGFSPYGFGPMPYRYYSPYYSPYSPYGTSSVSNDTRIQHSSLLFFDLKGKLVDDLGLKYAEIKLASKEQVSDYLVKNGIITMTCLNEKEIVLKQTSPDGSVVRDEKIKIELSDPEEEIRSESNMSTVRTWYKNNFYLFGYHTVRKKTEHHSRDVFYINRLTID